MVGGHEKTVELGHEFLREREIELSQLKSETEDHIIRTYFRRNGKLNRPC